MRAYAIATLAVSLFVSAGCSLIDSLVCSMTHRCLIVATPTCMVVDCPWTPPRRRSGPQSRTSWHRSQGSRMPASHCNRWWRVHPAHPQHSHSQSHPTPGLNHRLWLLSAVGLVSFEFPLHFHRLLARSLVGRGKPGGGLRYVHCAFEQFFCTADCCGITRIEIWQDEDYNEFKLHIFSAVLPLPLLFLFPCSSSTPAHSASCV